MRLLAALAAADLDDVREIAARGRELEGGPPGELRPPRRPSSTASRRERRDAYLAAAPGAADRVHFTGRLEHEDLPVAAARLSRRR